MDCASKMTHDFSYCTAENLKTLNDEKCEDIYGVIYSEHQGEHYITDVHFEPYESNGRRTGICLELYEEKEDGSHGRWVSSIYDIITAANYVRFVNRAKAVIEREILASLSAIA